MLSVRGITFTLWHSVVYICSYTRQCNAGVIHLMFFLPIWGFAFSQPCTGEWQRPTGILLQASKTLKGFKAVSGTQLLNWLILIKAWIGQDLDLALALAMSGIQYPKNVKVCQRLVREVKMYKQQGDTGYWVGKRGCASANDLFGLVICPQLARHGLGTQKQPDQFGEARTKATPDSDSESTCKQLSGSLTMPPVWKEEKKGE